MESRTNFFEPAFLISCVNFWFALLMRDIYRQIHKARSIDLAIVILMLLAVPCVQFLRELACLSGNLLEFGSLFCDTFPRIIDSECTLEMIK